MARDIGDGRVLISGEKWFCSNIDGEAIVLLAQPEGGVGGSAGLGLYLGPKHLADGSRNSYKMRRLKPKLGTRSVPTGEVELEGALGYALRPQRDDGTRESSDAGGLNRMMEMVNGSRFGVAMMGLGIARRSFLEAAVWAHHREAKGRLLVDLVAVEHLDAQFALQFQHGVDHAVKFVSHQRVDLVQLPGNVAAAAAPASRPWRRGAKGLPRPPGQRPL